jgi:hypothetical protein
MAKNFHTTIELPQGTLLRVREGAGVAITTHEGEVWITEQNSPRDVLLRAGEQFRLGRPGLAIVQVLGDASISFERREL